MNSNQIHVLLLTPAFIVRDSRENRGRGGSPDRSLQGCDDLLILGLEEKNVRMFLQKDKKFFFSSYVFHHFVIFPNMLILPTCLAGKEVGPQRKKTFVSWLVFHRF